MKKLISSFVVASGGLFLSATASQAASISFTPTGGQLDNDPIFDIQTAPGQIINFNVSYDTNNIITNPHLPFSVEIDFSIELDPTELKLVSLPKGTTATPNGFTTNKNAFAGIPQNMNGNLTTFQVKVLPGLINDGLKDVSLNLNFANIGGAVPIGQDVSNSFGGAGVRQIVEVQPCSLIPFQSAPNGGESCPVCGSCRVPEPSSTLSLLALGTLGAVSTLKRKQN